MGKRQAAALLLAVLMAGCAIPGGEGETSLPPPEPPATAAPPGQPQEEPEPSPAPQPEADVPLWDRETPHPYLKTLLEETAASLVTPGMSQYDRAKAAFDYMIRNTIMEEPVGPELWRVHGGGDQPVPFVEQRALSPLRFGAGMCEDYAAALTLLLRELGLQAQYVPGLTYSAEGHLVDHAWTVVEIDGVWYHLDSQLEDNISRRGVVRYKYFLRGDASLSVSHRWGQNLIDSGLLTAEQNQEIAQSWTPPPCPRDWPAPERSSFQEQPPPDVSRLRQEAAGELAAWETANGPLPPMTLNDTPPVFGLDGYGPADEG